MKRKIKAQEEQNKHQNNGTTKQKIQKWGIELQAESLQNLRGSLII